MIINLRQLISLAANFQGDSSNPSYTVEEFLEIYPQFTGKIPSAVMQYYISMGNSCLSYRMYGDQWSMAMSLYIAHFLTLYLQSTNGLTADSPASQVINSSMAYGLTASKSAGDLSKSYDYGSINDDLNGWAAWKLTIFGQQFASIAKLVGKAGSFIW